MTAKKIRLLFPHSFFPMKIRRLFLSLVLILISASGVRAEEAKSAAKPEKPETELEQTMAKMNKVWRQIRTAARDGTLTPAMADSVATMITNAEAAAKLTPQLEAEKPEADRAKFQADYEAQMKKLIETLGKLQAALKANDMVTATKLVAEAGDERKSGHNDFKKPDEKK